MTDDDRRAHFPAELLALARVALKRSSRWRKLGVPAADAEDILQGAFVRVLQRREVIERGAVEGFFRKAVLRETIAHARRSAVRGRAVPHLEAHVHVEAIQRSDGHPFRSAETECLLREATDVVAWLLEQVKPGRRKVAVECLGRILRDGELTGMDEIAASLGMAQGTVSSQWARAKQDMEAARDRDEAKTGKSRVAALLALLAGFWWWLVARGRRLLDPGAGEGEPRTAQPVARPDLAASGQRAAERAQPSARKNTDQRRLRGRALLACAALPLAVMTHAATRPRAITDMAYTAVAGLIQGPIGLADWQQGARAVAARMASVPVANTAPEREPAPSTPVRALPASRPTIQPPAALTSSPAAEAEGPREALRRAALLLKRGRTDLARIALRDYRRAYPEDPRPGEYSQLLAAADRLDGARGGGIR